MDGTTTGIDIHTVRFIGDHFDIRTGSRNTVGDLVRRVIGTITTILSPENQFLWEGPLDELDISPGIIDSIGFPMASAVGLRWAISFETIALQYELPSHRATEPIIRKT
jgi:hypothetical protein